MTFIEQEIQKYGLLVGQITVIEANFLAFATSWTASEASYDSNALHLDFNQVDLSEYWRIFGGFPEILAGSLSLKTLAC